MAKKVKEANQSKFLVYAPQITEALKSEVVEPKQKWMKKDLGEEHPYDYKLCENAYKKYGLAKAAVDKHLDFMFSQGFNIKSDNTKAKTIIKDFVEEKDLVLRLREWAQEAFIKGSSFMEIALDNKKKDVDLKVINSNSMFVKRYKSGEIEEYLQYTGGLNKFDSKKAISFAKDEIAHLPISRVGDEPYGIGIIYPALYIIDNILKAEKDMHLLMGRKANSPIIATIGSPEEPASAADVTAFGQQLVYLNNLHEWAVSHHVKFEALDFGNLSEKFATVLEHDKEVLFYAFQIPSVLMGTANVPEGLAKVQLDTFERRIQSIQDLIEDIVEDQIFEPILKMNGINAKVHIEWSQPSEESINDRVDRLTKIMAIPTLTPEFNAMLQKHTAELLGFEDADVNKLPDDEEMLQRKNDAERAKEEQNVQQPKIPGENPSNKKPEENEKVNKMILSRWQAREKDIKVEESLRVYEFINFHELAGFNYTDYLSYILSAVQSDSFDNLRATSEADYAKGLLSTQQIEQLRAVFDKAFTDNLTIAQIESDIKRVGLPDIKDGDTVVTSGADRANIIARTETVRLANQGLVDLYTDNNVEKVSWLASISDRTCPDCEALDGQIFEIGNLAVGVNQPPLHPNCRCTLLSVTE